MVSAMQQPTLRAPPKARARQPQELKGDDDDDEQRLEELEEPILLSLVSHYLLYSLLVSTFRCQMRRTWLNLIRAKCRESVEVGEVKKQEMKTKKKKKNWKNQKVGRIKAADVQHQSLAEVRFVRAPDESRK